MDCCTVQKKNIVKDMNVMLLKKSIEGGTKKRQTWDFNLLWLALPLSAFPNLSSVSKKIVFDL